MTEIRPKWQGWQWEIRRGVDAESRATPSDAASGKGGKCSGLSRSACVRVCACEGAGQHKDAPRAYGSGINCCHSCQRAESEMGCGFQRQGLSESGLPWLARRSGRYAEHIVQARMQNALPSTQGGASGQPA